MQISSILNPINMPGSTQPKLSILQSSTPPSNAFNTPVDGFVTRTIFGGISGKNMAGILFKEGAPGTQGLDAITKNAYVRQAAMSVGVGAGLYAGLSVFKQGIGMATGKQDARGAVANILTDSIRGGATGLGAVAGGGLTGLAMRAMGATGAFGTVMTFIGGAIGGSIGGDLIEATGIREQLVTTFKSNKAQTPTLPTPEPTPAQ